MVGAGMMVLVLIIHLPTVSASWLEGWRWWMVDGVCQWAVPWFFLVSGIMFRVTDGGGAVIAEVRKRIGTLLVPFFVLNAIWLPVMMGLNWIGTRYFGYQAVVTTSWHWVVRGLGLSPVNWPIDVPTWFLRALFVVVAIVGGIWSQVRFTRTRGLLVAAMFWGVYELQRVYWPEATDFFVFGVNLRGLALFSTGMLLAPWLRPAKMSEGDRRLKSWTWSLFVLHAPVLSLMLLPLKAFGAVEKVLGNPFAYAAFGAVALVVSIAAGRLLRVDLLRGIISKDNKSYVHHQ